MRPRVYLVHSQMKNTPSGWMPKYDYTEAGDYGDMVYVFPPNVWDADADELAMIAAEKMDGYSDRDYVLPVGNPALIGIVVGTALWMNGGRAKLLLWNNKTKEYEEIKVDLRTKETADVGSKDDR